MSSGVDRAEREKRTVSQMIALYCRKNHGGGKGLCPVCAELAAYACERSDRCPHRENKTFCSKCATPCYRPEMRERICEVMRFSGPRMMLHHPSAALRHLIDSRGSRHRRSAQDGSS